MYSRIKRREIKRDVHAFALSVPLTTSPIVLFTNPIPFYKYLYASYTLQENISLSSRVETRTLRLHHAEFATEFTPSLSWSLLFVYLTRRVFIT